jgi:hypothetical protein
VRVFLEKDHYIGYGVKAFLGRIVVFYPGLEICGIK